MVRLIFVFLFSLLSSGMVNANNGISTADKNVIVIDAGSTGSRLHLYTYEATDSHQVTITDKWSKKIKPGLATLTPNQESVDAYLDILFKDVPSQSQPVYFYATAGMRLLPEPQQNNYFKYLKHWFANHPQWTLVDGRTITGSEEGVFGWLAMNYTLGNFQDNQPSTAGLMDMGGASVQITFPIQNDANIDSHDVTEIDALGQHYKLFVHSFLGLGQTIASYQFLDIPSCFADNYLLPDGTMAHGDSMQCEQELGGLINSVHDVENIVKQGVINNPGVTWYAIGGLPPLVDSAPFAFDTNQFTSAELLDQANERICHKQWQDLQTLYPSDDYMYGYCLFPSYYYALMVEGYGISPKEPIHYFPKEKNIDWTLGVILHQINS